MAPTELGPHPGTESLSILSRSFEDGEHFVRTVYVCATLQGDWQIARATFDTGSVYNWVSKTYLSERLGIQIKAKSRRKKHLCITFNGAIVSPVGVVQLMWYGRRARSRRSCLSTFLVLDDDIHIFDLLIGSTTIVKEKILAWDVGTAWTLIGTPLGGKGRLFHWQKLQINVNVLRQKHERRCNAKKKSFLTKRKAPFKQVRTFDIKCGLSAKLSV